MALVTSVTLAVAPVSGTAAEPAAAASDVSRVEVDAAVAQLDALATDLMAKSGNPGMAVAGVHHGKQVYAKGFGVRRVGSPGMVGPNTVFQLASVSKSLGANTVPLVIS